MNQPDGLLDGIHQKILDGTLPKQNCRMTWFYLASPSATINR